MIIRLVTILLAIAGLFVGALAVGATKEVPANPPLASPPSVNPYEHGIAAAGLLEAASRNIAIAAPEQGLVIKVHVDVGQTVAAGAPLFELDTRVLESERLKAQAALALTRAQLARAESAPRPEEGPPLRAEITRAESFLADAQDQYDMMAAVGRNDAATTNELARRRFAVDIAKALLTEAQSKFSLWQSGTWSLEQDIARAQVAQAQAQLDAVQQLIDRLTVRSPVAGTVLKRNIEPGQYTTSSLNAQGAMVVGDISHLHVRARVDEEDAPRLKEAAAAKARIRGQSAVMLPLTMLRIEPLAIAKTDLTGSNNERVDTRVVEVIFDLPASQIPPQYRLFPGQVLDVFIDAPQSK